MSAEGSSSKHPGLEEREREARNTNDSSKAGPSKPRGPGGGPGSSPHLSRAGGENLPRLLSKEEMTALCAGRTELRGLCMQRREPEAQSPASREASIGTTLLLWGGRACGGPGDGRTGRAGEQTPAAGRSYPHQKGLSSGEAEVREGQVPKDLCGSGPSAAAPFHGDLNKRR